MNPILSIIIPCFNSELTLHSTLKSVYDQAFEDWEAIIVNDGSVDKTEQIAMQWVQMDSRFKYFSKLNEGLGKTRNFAILRSKGIYLLPLDSDNLIGKDFANDAIKIFKNDHRIGVVHGHAEYFGAKNGIWKIDEYSFEKMLITNYIDACAIFKKDLFDKVNGYDTQMPFQGNEDWDLWLAFGVLDVKFHHLKKVTFKYYVHNNSMIRSFTDEMFIANQDYVIKKYSKIYYDFYIKKISLIEVYSINPLLAIKQFVKDRVRLLYLNVKK